MSRSSRFLGHQLAAIAAKLTICLCIVFALTVLAVGQETTGGIKGYIKDRSGASVAGAEVELSGGGLITPRKVETDSAGYFYFQLVPPGNYTVTTSAKGFRTYKQIGIDIASAKLPTLEIVMEVGAVSETIEVSGVAATIDTTSAQLSTSYNERYSQDLGITSAGGVGAANNFSCVQYSAQRVSIAPGSYALESSWAMKCSRNNTPRAAATARGRQ